MKNLYYSFWVNVIVDGRKNQPERTDWKISLFMLITAANSFNLYVIMLWLKYFNIFSYSVHLDFMPNTMINGALEYIVEYASPFILLNYFLIFHKDRYKKLIEKYPPNGSKFPLVYFLSSVFSMFFSVIIYVMIS
jgi:hypothetical protein